MNFADGVWDGTRAGVFIDASTCGTMQIAYDVGSNRDAPFSSIKEKLAEAIVKDYSVISSELGATRGDVFLWASRQGNGEVRRGIIAFRANRQP